MSPSQLLVTTAQDGVDLPADAPRYSLFVAQTADEVVAAQRLRYQVFAEEMGATLHSDAEGLDVDAFDELCDHLVVRDDDTGDIVGTYRMLPADRVEPGKLYSHTEFDLTAIDSLRDSLVETGRSCVHSDHRTGAVVSLVWAGIARYMLLSGKTRLAGCASVPLADGGSYALGVWNQVREKHYAPDELRVRPLNPWEPEDGVQPPERAALPPLLKGYLRLGARVCGPPAHDPDFGVADLFVLLDLADIDQRYIKFFLGDQ
ncbi:putative hemolysin [Herbihabitans rhizosphaerae]|uniref:Putative hemolysin n=1 Tax=Herbihabitans rhizosphaerae TaxID=1872711 RepID=A0A4Q7KSE9_9PSEU|nr:GNAT family N-acyltransferase [Herbihabitans rhizosphaerae]RZS39040.1 putative hemolysin [Herbihabitans rhizosphaerae]